MSYTQCIAIMTAIFSTKLDNPTELENEVALEKAKTLMKFVEDANARRDEEEEFPY